MWSFSAIPSKQSASSIPARHKAGQTFQNRRLSGSHYVTTRDNLDRAIADIRAELAQTLAALKEQNKLVEYQRLKQRTNYDLK